MTTARLLSIIRTLYQERATTDPSAAARYVEILTWPTEKLEIALENQMLGPWADLDADGIRGKAGELVALMEAGQDVTKILKGMDGAINY